MDGSFVIVLQIQCCVGVHCADIDLALFSSLYNFCGNAGITSACVWNASLKTEELKRWSVSVQIHIVISVTVILVLHKRYISVLVQATV